MNVLRAWKSVGWKSKAAMVLAALYVLYALLGFLLVPGLVRDNGREALTQLLGRQVAIQDVKFNPLALSATVNGFAIADEQTEVLLGFDQLYVNFQLSSLFRWSWHFDEILMDGLTIRAQRNPDSVFSFDDVIAHVNQQLAERAPQDESEADTAEEGGLPNISVALLQLANGDLRYTEAVGEDAHSLVLPVAFNVTNFTTQKAEDEEQNQNGYAVRLEGPDGGAFDWNGHFAFSPFEAEGKLQVEKVDLVQLAKLAESQVRFTVPSGELDLAVHYQFRNEPDARLLLSDGHMALRKVALLKPGEENPSLALEQVEVTGMSLDSGSQEVVIPRVLISQPKVQAVLEQQGLDLATLFLPLDEAKAEARADAVKEKAQQAAERISEAQTLWVVRLDELALQDGAVDFIDRTLTPARSLALSQGALTLKNLILGKEDTFQWQGSAVIEGQGQLSHSGDGQLAPLAINAKASASKLPLVPLSPWLEREAPMSVKDGELAVDMVATVKGETPDISLKGAATLSNFNLLEGGRPLLKVNKAELEQLDLATASQVVRIGEIGLTGMDMLHQVDAQGRDVATRIAAAMPAQTGAGSDSAKAAAEGKPWQVTVDRVNLVGSQVRHEDLSLSPNFRIGLYQLAGNLRNLDSRPGRKARIDLTAQVDRYAPFSAKGTLSPEPLYTDMAVSLKNYEMTSLSPYTGQYLGYAVEKGQLGVDTGVSIQKNQLESKSDILADQFYLGEKVPSEEAVKAPVKLGLSVLRNRSGKITLPVKMSGDLNDPSFSVSGMILKVLGNIVVKAATAPFSILSGLAGGENLETIPFDVGSSEVGLQTRQSLTTLSQVLQERPDLHIGLVGTTDAEDRQALAGAWLGNELAGDDWQGIEWALTESKWRRKLKNRYEKDTDKPVESLVKEPLPDDKEQQDMLLAEAAWQALITSGAGSVSKAELNELARLRSENAKAELVQQLGIDQARIYLKDTKVDGKLAGLTLTLEK